MMMSSPILYDARERFGEAQREGLEYILERDSEDFAFEPWDMEIQDAYETTLSYIGGILLLLNPDDEKYNLNDARRRLVIFPMAVKKKFIELTQEVRPRAMVIMAYYFAILVIEKLWWVGDVGRLEVQAVDGSLPAKWQKMMEWPLRVVKAGRILPIQQNNGA
ncbi:c6 finger domain-containing [Trichoderma arundinaceum]|uniref:C6 finger domain-containing n=1 Tax=Trichoderma arundinaceum TaxID=490622 RepID=A0A395NFI1_TRIAR|nr:c6 finger domain-containing [Trichoderma arundinaceum]